MIRRKILVTNMAILRRELVKARIKQYESMTSSCTPQAFRHVTTREAIIIIIMTMLFQNQIQMAVHEPCHYPTNASETQYSCTQRVAVLDSCIAYYLVLQTLPNTNGGKNLINLRTSQMQAVPSFANALLGQPSCSKQ